MEIDPGVNSQWFVDISEPNSSRGTSTRFIIGSNSTCTFFYVRSNFWSPKIWHAIITANFRNILIFEYPNTQIYPLNFSGMIKKLQLQCEELARFVPLFLGFLKKGDFPFVHIKKYRKNWGNIHVDSQLKRGKLIKLSPIYINFSKGVKFCHLSYFQLFVNYV